MSGHPDFTDAERTRTPSSTPPQRSSRPLRIRRQLMLAHASIHALLIRLGYWSRYGTS